MFSAGEKLFIIADFTGQDGKRRPIFLCLVVVFFCHYNKPAFEFNLKTGS